MEEVNKLLELNKLALSFVEKGHYTKAQKMFIEAIMCWPKNPLLYFNLGNVYRQAGNIDKADEAYKKSLKIYKRLETFKALGLMHLDIRNYKEAVKYLLETIKFKQNDPSNYYYLAYVYEKLSEFKKAIFYYKKCIQTSPEYELASSRLFIVKRRICEWEGLDKLDKYLHESHKETPWTSLVRTENQEDNLLAAKAWSEQISKKTPDNLFSFANRKQNRKIRIGYISGNFFDHPLGYMASSIFKHHNHKKFDIYSYSYGKNDKSIYRKSVEKNSKRFVDIANISNLLAAKQIYSDNIDILIDLTGHTDNNRLQILAMKPAPVQINWSALGTSGAPFFDYALVDKIVTPSSSYKYYSEKALLLPHCHFLTRDDSATQTNMFVRRDFGLPDDLFVFGVFHQMYKIEPEIWSVWMKILKRVSNSVLWLWEQNKEGKKNLIKYASNYGVGKARLIFAKSMTPEEYLSRLNLADIALDTKIYGGGTTTSLSLIRGVPTIAILGNNYTSRISASVLHFTKCPELIASSEKDYEDIAVNLAQNPKKLKRIKNKLKFANLKSSLLNYPQVVADLEKIYQTIVTA